MLKRNRTYLIVTSLITILPIIIGLLLWNRLPEQLVTHFDASGQADGWSSKAVTVFGIFPLILACHLICAFATAADPRRKAISDRIYHLILWICPVCSLFVAVMVYGNALNYPLNITLLCNLFLGLLFVILGNYLPKCRQNYTVGIKLPWTLDDADTWNATHRMAGPIWIAGGIIMILTGLTGKSPSWLMFVILLAAALIPCLYSFFYYQRKHREEREEKQTHDRF